MARLTQKKMERLIGAKMGLTREETFRLSFSDIQKECGGRLEKSYEHVSTFMTNCKKSPFREACEVKGVIRLGVYKGNNKLENSDLIDLDNCADVFIEFKK